MNIKPIEVLFGTYRRKVLALLLLRPDEQFHVREIARLIDVPAGSLHRELKSLAGCELLIRKKTGNQVYYQANRDSRIFTELASLFKKTSGLADVIRDALTPLQENLELVFIFGSVAQGNEHSGSDIDLFVVGSVSFTEVVGALSDLYERLGREINPVVLSRDEFTRKKSSDPFVKRILADKKIYLRGDDNDFGKLVVNGTAEETQYNS